MAHSMMTDQMKNAAVARCAVAAFTLLISVPATLLAEDLPDPTRPPAGIFAPASGTRAGRQAMVDHSSGLHLVIISKNRRAAVIDGKMVELGGDHGHAKLVEVNEGDVVLQRAQSRQVLTLFPGVKITRKPAVENRPAQSDKESADKQ
jgi:MSHA biogenesis protein MshK